MDAGETISSFCKYIYKGPEWWHKCSD